VFFILLVPISFLVFSLPSKTGNVIYTILFLAILGFGFVVTFFGFLLNYQSFYIEGDALIVKNCLYEVMFCVFCGGFWKIPHTPKLFTHWDRRTQMSRLTRLICIRRSFLDIDRVLCAIRCIAN
jgi:hypothetical protein